jgi:endonuclease/exonuclease/phosphatase (EEP) superfamily protein YafD
VIVLPVLATLFVVFVALRLSGVDGNRYTAAALALTPYGVPFGGALGVLALVLSRWWTGGIVLAATALLVTQLVRRVTRSVRPDRSGRPLRVLAANLYLGRGDVKTVVELVREHRVDVLNLLELTPEAVDELDRAGLFDLLPYRVLRPAAGGAGSGVVCRHPLSELSLVGPSRLAQPSVHVDLGGIAVQVVAVHPVPPTVSAAAWREESAVLPRPASIGPVRILAGDFNATLDHAVFRQLLRTGYLDAGQQCGAGLVPTWPGLAVPPLVTLDHIVVDARATVVAFRVFDLPGSDHRCVYAELLLPEHCSSEMACYRCGR